MWSVKNQIVTSSAAAAAAIKLHYKNKQKNLNYITTLIYKFHLYSLYKILAKNSETERISCWRFF